ncbi:hypothetical protein GUJ93_ZPchr0010g9199 [Zizania palustris]|uniref:Uncharacterized protein n=1 Tax=Zizania palustris TaxID=103762 RepID=A0A8J5SZ76_ZIZPA|nr:hypothetical protein GUJ93_ZPchr0010g9199 [Zizania palustris]
MGRDTPVPPNAQPEVVVRPTPQFAGLGEATGFTAFVVIFRGSLGNIGKPTYPLILASIHRLHLLDISISGLGVEVVPKVSWLSHLLLFDPILNPICLPRKNDILEDEDCKGLGSPYAIHITVQFYSPREIEEHQPANASERGLSEVDPFVVLNHSDDSISDDEGAVVNQPVPLKLTPKPKDADTKGMQCAPEDSEAENFYEVLVNGLENRLALKIIMDAVASGDGELLMPMGNLTSDGNCAASEMLWASTVVDGDAKGEEGERIHRVVRHGGNCRGVVERKRFGGATSKEGEEASRVGEVGRNDLQTQQDLLMR